jgi:hypothetical protein
MKQVVIITCCLCSSFTAVSAYKINSDLSSVLQECISLQMVLQDDTLKSGKRAKIISSEAGTFGYEIYSGGKLLIRQTNIPGIGGNKGFKRKSDAEKVAKLVLEKLDKGIMPPTVEKAEMEKLKVEF